MKFLIADTIFKWFRLKLIFYLKLTYISKKSYSYFCNKLLPDVFAPQESLKLHSTVDHPPLDLGFLAKIW